MRKCRKIYVPVEKVSKDFSDSAGQKNVINNF